MNEKNVVENRVILEKIKSILIVVLVLNTILLLYFFWADISIRDLKLSDLNIDFIGDDDIARTLYPEDVLLPTYMGISTLDGEYIVVTDTAEYYGKRSEPDCFADELARLLTSGELVVEEVPADQYEEAYQQQAVKCVFDYSLPAADYFAKMGVEKIASLESLGEIREIGFTSVALDSILVSDRIGRTEASGGDVHYYRIVTGTTTNFVDSLLAREELYDMPYYYRIGEFMGEQVTSPVKLPLYLSSDMTRLQVEPEVTLGEDGQMDIDARSFFGNGFDFVRKIEEASGKTTYMYGYAETVLIADPDGSVEYKADTSGGGGLDYYAALDLALAFIDQHNTSIQGDDYFTIQPVLTRVVQSPSDKRSYRFEFGFRANGEEIFFEKPPLVVEVTGGNVSYYYRKAVALHRGSTAQQEAFSAVNIIATNYAYLEKALSAVTQDSKDKKGRLSVDAVAQKILTVKYGYVILEDSAIPVWELRIKGLDAPLYFDLYTATPVER